MAKPVARLLVSLEAGTASFIAGMDKAANKVKGFTASVFKGALGANLVTGALTTLSSAVKGLIDAGLAKVAEQFKEIDDAAKEARRLGVTTQVLLEIRHAANLAGVGAEAFGSSIQKLQKNIVEANRGTKTMVLSFDALGVSAEELVNLPLGRQLEVIADALQKVQNPAERLNIALSIFGKSGAGMLNVLEEGAAGLKKYRQEMQALRGVITDEDAKKIEAANDAVTRLQESIKGLAQTIAVQTAESRTKLVDMLTLLIAAQSYVAKRLVVKANLFGHKFNIFGSEVPMPPEGTIWGTGGVAPLPERDTTVRNFKLIGEIIDKTRQQAKEYGLTAEQAAMQQLIEAGATKEQVYELMRLQELMRDMDIEKSMHDRAKSAKDIMDALGNQLRFFNFRPDEIGLANLQDLGASQDQINTYKKMMDTLKRWNKEEEENNRLLKLKQGALEELRTPLEIVAQRETELRTLLNAGLITQQQFDTLKGKALDSLASPTAGSAGAIQAGSLEEFKLLHDTSKKDLELQKQQLRAQLEIARNTGNASQVTIVNAIF